MLRGCVALRREAGTDSVPFAGERDPTRAGRDPAGSLAQPGQADRSGRRHRPACCLVRASGGARRQPILCKVRAPPTADREAGREPAHPGAPRDHASRLRCRWARGVDRFAPAGVAMDLDPPPDRVGSARLVRIGTTRSDRHDSFGSARLVRVARRGPLGVRAPLPIAGTRLPVPPIAASPWNRGWKRRNVAPDARMPARRRLPGTGSRAYGSMSSSSSRNWRFRIFPAGLRGTASSPTTPVPAP